MESNKNYKLIFGAITLILLLIMSFFPDLFTSNDPIFEEPAKYIEFKEDGIIKKELARNPIRPNKENLMGTDDAGRDIYARIIFGTKNTMKLVFLIAIFRMILAFPIGILGGINIRPFSTIIKFLNTLFTSVPILVISFFIFNFNYFDRLQIDKSIIVFAIILSLLGFAKLASIIEDQTKVVMNEDFIEGEIAIGKTKKQIVFQNIIPHLMPVTISLFFKEIASSLFLMAQLAVLSIFVGTSRESKEMSFRANYEMGFEPEWGGMLTKITSDIQNLDKVWWPTIYPIIIFTISIVGLNSLGEGLRVEFEKRDSRVITSIRNIFSNLSPKILYLQFKEFKKYKKQVIIKLTTISLIIIYIFIPKYKSLYEFNSNNVFKYAEELTKDEFEGRITGTEGGYKAGNYIIEELENFGFKTESYFLNSNEIDNNDILSLDSLTPLFVEEGKITVRENNGESREFYLYKDFEILTLNRDELISNKGKEKLFYSGVNISEKNISKKLNNIDIIPVFNNYPMDIYWDNGIDEENIIKSNDGSEFDFDIAFNLPNVESSRVSTNLHRYHSIIPKGELLDIILSGENKIEIEFSYPKLPEYKARNIIGFLESDDEANGEEKETIIIGGSYDGLHIEKNEDFGYMSAIPSSIMLELAKEIGKLEETLSKNIMFIFWDNEFEVDKNTFMQGSVKFNEVDQKTIDLTFDGGYVYFDIAYPGYQNEIKELNLVTFPSQMSKKGSFHAANNIENSLKKRNIKYRRYQNIYGSTNFSTPYGRYEIGSRALFNMRLNSNLSVGIGSSHVYDMYTEKDKLNNIDKEKVNVIGQTVLDALTMNEFLMGDLNEFK